jgi:hypothetical protein
MSEFQRWCDLHKKVWRQSLLCSETYYSYEHVLLYISKLAACPLYFRMPSLKIQTHTLYIFISRCQPILLLTSPPTEEIPWWPICIPYTPHFFSSLKKIPLQIPYTHSLWTTLFTAPFWKAPSEVHHSLYYLFPISDTHILFPWFLSLV